MPLRKSPARVERILIEGFEAEFAKLYSCWYSLIETCPSRVIHRKSSNLAQGFTLPSVGESVLRSAAAVEQTCGGITANLWDDGFEWTLPETLSTRERILEYLDEVETTRKRAFGSFLSDPDLLKVITTPSGKVQTLASLLLQTLARACQLQGQASLTAEIFSAQNDSGFTI
ncbi:MAG TPA: hypothetical protein VJ180_00160 [Pyrinomonadaceae bacterium]|nr:hypothetical protein [Pyrinomonadaceae bacterium]